MACWLGAEGFCPWYVGLVLRVSVLGMLAWCRGCLSLVCWLGAEDVCPCWLGAEGFCPCWLGAEGFSPCWFVGLVLRVSVLGMLAGAEGFCPWYAGLVLRVSVLDMLAWCKALSCLFFLACLLICLFAFLLIFIPISSFAGFFRYWLFSVFCLF